jgi:hypothetical protein
MKLLRIGALILIIGISLLVATHLRIQRELVSSGSFDGVFGPFVLEPKETTIVLRDVSPQNVTMFVVNALSWRRPENITSQDISKIQPVFTFTGLFKRDAVTLRIQWRGIYYIVIVTNTSEPVDFADIAFEQRGIPQDLLHISETLIGIGMIIIAIQPLKTLIKRKKPKTEEQHKSGTHRLSLLCLLLCNYENAEQLIPYVHKF